MGSTHRFLAIDDESDVVLRWFRDLPIAPHETVASARGRWLHFPHLGALAYREEGLGTPEVDPTSSPLVSFVPPRRRRGVLWTTGEVHFLPTPLKGRFPQLDSISRSFARWLSQFDRVFSRRSPVDDWSYYLEGNIRNHDSDVFALPRAMAALKQGQYFVGEDDTPERLETVCRALRLRGIDCAPGGDA